MRNDDKRIKMIMWKSIVLAILFYSLSIIIVSMFLGSCFTDDQGNPGWIYTHFYMLILCALLALFAMFVYIKRSIEHMIEYYDAILIKNHDAKGYLEAIDQTLTSCQKQAITGSRKYYFLLLENRYVYALLCSCKLDFASYYLEHMWRGNRKRRLYMEPYAITRWLLDDGHEDQESLLAIIRKSKDQDLLQYIMQHNKQSR